MNDHETRTLSIIVLPEGEAVFSEMATTITIVDDAGGEFVVIEQSAIVDAGKIRIDPTEWTALKSAIDRMFRSADRYRLPFNSRRWRIRSVSSFSPSNLNSRFSPISHSANV